WTLFFEVARIVTEKQPKVVLLENVKGLLSDDNGKTLHVILKTLNDAGYLVDFKIINSKEHGVAQSRERVFIIGVREDIEEHRGWVIRGSTVEGRNKRELARDKSIKMFKYKISNNKRKYKNIIDIMESNVDESFYVKEDKLDILMKTLEEKGYGNEVNKSKKRPKGLFNKKREEKGKQYDLDKTGYIDTEGYDTHNMVYSIHGLAPTLNASCGGETHVLLDENGKYRVRRLTTLECVRLQAFPEEFYYIMKENGISNTQIYKQTGNAVTVTVNEDIMKSLLRKGYLVYGK